MLISEIKEKCKEVLHKASISSTFLDGQIDTHFENKAWIAELLNLNEANNFRHIQTIKVNFDNRPELKSLLKYIEFASDGKYKIKDLNYMAFEGNTIKVTKAMSDTWDSMLEHCKTRLNHDIAIGREEFLRLYYKAMKTEDIKHRLLCMFGDKLKDNRLVNISLNPYDFLTSSGEPYCSFTSCIRMEGEYFNTLFDYFNSDCVVSSFVSESDKPERKIGRQFVYMSPNAVVQTRVFGAMSKHDMKMVMDYILSRNGGEWEERQEAPCRADFDIKRTPYIDTMGVYMKRKDTKQAPFLIPAGFCLKCGGKLDKEYNRGGLCSTCVNLLVKCASCGSRGEKDKFNKIRDHYYCHVCYTKYAKICVHCGQLEMKDNMANMKGIGDVCYTCYNLLTFECACCGQRKPTEEKNVIQEGYIVCKGCFKRYVPCAICGEKFYDANMVIVEGLDKDIPICITCYKKKPKAQVPKGKVKQTATMVKVDGMLYAFENGKWTSVGEGE